MGGFTNVLHRMTTASFVFGLAFVFPNVALAQAPRLQPIQPIQPGQAIQPIRLSWQTPAPFTEAASFDNGWTRVLSDTQKLLRRFAPTTPLQNIVTIDEAARATAARALWASAARAYALPAPKPPRMNVGGIRTTFKPVQFSSRVAAESRGIEGVIAGVQFEMLD